MRLRTDLWKAREAALLTGVMSVAMLPSLGALAADQAVIPKAPAVEIIDWYFYGGFEVGGRFYAERPPSGFGRAPAPANWLTSQTTDSRAKFEEYGSVRPGLFLDWINLQAGTKDGRYAFDFWGKSVGANNQSYYLDLAKVGEHYLSVGWDEIPHLISTSGKTVFGGVGSSALTVDPALRANLQTNLPNATATGAAGQTARTNIENFVNNAATRVNLATQRAKASAAYRYTPNEDVEVKAEYSHEQRTGTRPTAISYGWGTTANPRATNVVEVPQPIDDVTQNLAASGEYVGTTPWATRWTSSLKYAGSFYTNNIDRLDVQNPFCISCNVLAGSNRGPNTLRLALYPGNQANAVTWNTAVGLPFNSRYVATVQYNRMQQNDAFVSTATNGLLPNPVTLAGVPVGSLNGEVNTLLVNNVWNGTFGKDLKLTVKGRHYDVDNRTPSLLLTNYVASDSGRNTAGGAGRMSLPLSYTKDNASAELVWRTPVKWASIGGGYYWERWDRKFRDVDVTNEHMGKVWLNADPIDWARVRASVQYSERRYREYNTEELVEAFAGPGNFSEVVSNMRKFDIANRNRTKAEAFVEFTPLPNLTVTPNAGLRFDAYPDPVFNPLGLRKDDSWNAGIELGVKVNNALRLFASYNYEDHEREIAGGSGGANIIPLGAGTGCPTAAALNPTSFIGTNCTWRSDIAQRYHTFMLAADWKAIPNTLEFRVEYLTAFATEANATTPCPSLNLGCTGGGTGVTTTQFPDEKNSFQRFNVTGRYIVDPAVVRQLGWNGEVVAKVRYTWERNRADNWAYDTMTPYIPSPDQTTDLTGAGRSLFLAVFNPNYTAQIVAASLAFRW